MGQTQEATKEGEAMSAKHTPGPWAFTYDGSSGWSIGPESDPQAFAVVSLHDRNDETARANAALIAASPEAVELISSLRKALRMDHPESLLVAEAGDWLAKVGAK